jgi:cyclophilin family peptidyl-prolyl cis-trans isomerase
METSMGKIKLELFPDKSPLTVQNFLHYVEKKHYDGTIFHQAVANYYIQGGEIEPGLQKKRKPDAPIKSEANNGLSNLRGTISLAQIGGPDSGTASFFINIRNNHFLDRANAKDGIGQCVFGKVIEGMDVVDRISEVPIRNVGKLEGVPKDDIIIKSVKKIN